MVEDCLYQQFFLLGKGNSSCCTIDLNFYACEGRRGWRANDLGSFSRVERCSMTGTLQKLSAWIVVYLATRVSAERIISDKLITVEMNEAPASPVDGIVNDIALFFGIALTRAI